MPKIPMNFQNSVIYKIVSNNLDNKDCYVGSTTNFDKRKASHKNTHNNQNNKQYNKPLYKFIRENGGWNDFSMILVENYPCNNKNELFARERYFIQELKASLNRVIPLRTDKEYRNDNKDKKKISDKNYRENPKYREKLLKKKHIYAIENSEKIVEKVRQWRLKDPELTKKKRADEYQRRKQRQKHQQLIVINNQLDKNDLELTSEFNRLCSLINPLI